MRVIVIVWQLDLQLCNQCLFTTKVVSLSVTYGRSMVFSWCSGFPHQ